jgi:Icc-related predicted phosphoesterase
VKLWVLSDLHLDVNAAFPFELPAPRPVHDVVVIAGDIQGDMADAVRWLDRVGLNTRPVIYIGGNHEFYGHDRLGELAVAREATSAVANIHILERDAIVIGGVRFLGATLWTDYALYNDPIDGQFVAERMLSDHRLIRNGVRAWTAGDALEEHQGSRAWLEQQLAVPHAGRTVVVSHHAPSARSVESKFKNDRLTPAFGSNLDALLPSVDIWIHGHMHSACDYQVAGCRIINNPRGYLRRERTGFRDDLIVDVRSG